MNSFAMVAECSLRQSAPFVDTGEVGQELLRAVAGQHYCTHTLLPNLILESMEGRVGMPVLQIKEIYYRGPDPDAP